MAESEYMPYLIANSGRIDANSTQPVDPTLSGLIPPGYEPGPYVQRLEAIVDSGRVLPDQMKVLQGRIEAIHKAMDPFPDYPGSLN
ncbi:hypothetical protein XI03_25815 [Bradyrhizobium sp. CCBAU 65884]|uniref:hypothetical protein n=1 Tax=Bradyrhizobium sp. CCBAU 65884 TaxID=722477 RepID=UPI0023055AA2|nr:hypothetical protein [Bradyrhizobium sp. CCBAU 65884]MDA9477837.1 hypothetical protein [Bradyrhizobium sp. CCBAU 65884]